MSMLLAFHKNILEKIHDPSTNELLLLARGLGMRRIICKLLQIYDSPQSLILLVGASPEEESAIGEELGIMGCKKPGLRIVGFETGKKDRQDLYKKGGLISITSQILTVDMLTSEMPTHLITGILILHAERATPTSPEAFIVRLYREKNKSGFLKAFSDQPEHIISGMSPLRTIMKELQLRTVHIYPRFHQEVIDTLGRDRSSVLQLTIDMTEYMTEIHGATVQCMTTTLSELKRSNTSLDLDDLNVENAYFRSFDMIVRRQLDTVWHKVGPRTKQLVNDLATLRRLLNYLLSYDALAFHAYLETLIASNTVNDAGNARQNQSPWMLTDAANIIFQYAKRRCYTVTKVAPTANPQPIHDVDDEDAWAALDEMEGMTAKRPAVSQRAAQRPKWLPDGIEPVLEELPKWSLVAAALQEIEEEMIRRESQLSSRDPGTNTVLIMTSSLRTSQSLNEFLSSMNSDSPPGTEGRKMMESKLRTYFWWKSRFGERKQENKPQGSTHGGPKQNQNQRNNPTSSELSEALKKKDREKQARAASRRRARGGGPPNAGASRDKPPSEGVPSGPTDGKGPADDSDTIAEFLATQDGDLFLTSVNGGLSQIDFPSDFDAFYGILPAEQTVLIRAYSDDTDELMLAEVQPRYIIMFEPNLDFVRRVEVYKKSNPGLGVRVYLLVYNFSCEEAKYLAGVRREKDAFERLIRERGSMLMPILEERRSESTDSLIKTISSRIAGGRKEINTEPSRVIVDMREFRSSLPSLLHASNLLVVPVTLTVGDYILTPDICVERKSIPDLVSSFNSGRLYTQCELMSVHYKQPILLIEWEEHKSFSLDTVADVKSYAKASNKYPSKKQAAANTDANVSAPTIQSKLVLLTLTFPRVRIIWSSSPYATAQIFNDLKSNNPEPDPLKAVTVGAEEDPEVGAGVNTAAEELLRTFPGITSKNVKHVMNKVKSVRELCELSLPAVQEILGVQPGKACYEFMHHGEQALIHCCTTIRFCLRKAAAWIIRELVNVPIAQADDCLTSPRIVGYIPHRAITSFLPGYK